MFANINKLLLLESLVEFPNRHISGCQEQVGWYHLPADSSNWAFLNGTDSRNWCLWSPRWLSSLWVFSFSTLPPLATSTLLMLTVGQRAKLCQQHPVWSLLIGQSALNRGERRKFSSLWAEYESKEKKSVL